MHFNKIVLIILLNIFSTYSFSQKKTRADNSRSDSLDITKINLTIIEIDKIAKTINANALINMTAKLNGVNKVELDLQGFTVDSVLINNIVTSFNYTSPLLEIPLATTLQIGDQISLQIFYHGTPPTDGQWGGYYSNATYSFNMGVGFVSHPHVVGRMLFPCFDNFVERQQLEFYIYTDITDFAMCNGTLKDSTLSNNKIIWHWNMNEEIPSYLVGIAVAPYYVVKLNVVGINGQTPVWIAGLPSDSNKIIASFNHLQSSFSMLENYFGAYAWSKVGYSLVPFSAGAMEHAGNIHIGLAYIDGTLTYETLIAHELSHHWFGNLATCSTVGDMWLNEGFASYCELLHTEYQYGKNDYKKAYIKLHYDMLSKAHINDDGYRSVSNMDSNHAYGTTVYQKGADMLHTLRSYLGDSLFFNGLKYYLNNNQFKAVSTTSLQNNLNTFTNKTTNDFFADWIHQPGFLNFCIDSINKKQEGSNWRIKINVRQRKHQTNHYGNNVLLPISFFENNHQHTTFHTNFTGQCMQYDFLLPYNPAFISLDEDDAISDASTFNTIKIKTIGTQILNEAKARIVTKSIAQSTDSILLRIEHQWVKPDRFKTPQGNYVMNDSRYWVVDGINLNLINGYLGFNYNATSNNQFLDSSWIKAPESGIKLFYRKDATQDWQATNDSIVVGATSDRIGIVYCKSIQAGEYAFGINRPGYIDPIVTDAPIGPCNVANNIEKSNIENRLTDLIQIFPNPTQKTIHFKTKQRNIKPIDVIVLDSKGVIIYSTRIAPKELEKQITINWPSGLYTICFSHESVMFQNSRIIVH